MVKAGKWLVLAFVTICCLAALVFSWPSRVVAQDKACTYSLESTAAMLAMSGNFYIVLNPPDRDRFVRNLSVELGFHLPAVSNVLIADYGGQLVYGLEMGGCLGSPIPLAKPAVPVRRPVKGIAA